MSLPTSLTELSSLLQPADLQVDRGPYDRIDHLVLTCSDGFFSEFLADWIKTQFGRADIIAVPGGALELNLPGLMATMTKRLQTLDLLHHTRHVWLVSHNSCGGYGICRGTDGNLLKERELQLGDWARIDGLLRGRHGIPEVRLHFGLLRTNGAMRGPEFVPLKQLAEQTHALGLSIPSLEQDLAERIPQLPLA